MRLEPHNSNDLEGTWIGTLEHTQIVKDGMEKFVPAAGEHVDDKGYKQPPVSYTWSVSQQLLLTLKGE